MPTSMPTVWRIDPAHTSVQFSVRHLMMTNVRGVFSKATGTVTLDESDFTRSEIDVDIDVASIDTRERQRDDHLRSADFLDAANFPKITFRSTQIVPDGGEFVVTGDLTIHGVTRQVKLEVEAPAPAGPDPWGGLRRGFEARGEIKRSDFGMVWNQALETGGVVVGDKVKINLEIQLVQVQA